MPFTFSVSASANIGRGNDFVAFGKIVALCNSIVNKGFLPTSTIILDSDGESLPMASAAGVLVDLLNQVKAKSDGSEPTFKVGERSYKRSELENLIAAWADTEEAQAMGKPVAIGNSRALACTLGWALGHSIEPNVKSQVVSPQLAIADNEANALATRLDDKQRLISAIALYEQGKISNQSDLRRTYKDGVGQKLWIQVLAVVIHGMDIDQALKLKSDIATRAAVALNGKAAIKALKDIVNGEVVEEPKYKTIPGKTLADWAKTMPEWSELLTALAHGQEVTARLFLAHNAPQPTVEGGIATE